jgi:hypothetical protein
MLWSVSHRTTKIASSSSAVAWQWGGEPRREVLCSDRLRPTSMDGV